MLDLRSAVLFAGTLALGACSGVDAASEGVGEFESAMRCIDCPVPEPRDPAPTARRGMSLEEYQRRAAGYAPRCAELLPSDGLSVLSYATELGLLSRDAVTWARNNRMYPVLADGAVVVGACPG